MERGVINVSKEHKEAQKVQENDCGCGSNKVLHSRRVEAAPTTNWGKNKKSIKSRFLR